MAEVTIAAADGGSFSAYISLPRNATGKVPGIVMMQQMLEHGGAPTAEIVRHADAENALGRIRRQQPLQA